MPDNILARIIAHKREETAARMRAAPLAEIRRQAAAQPPPRPFAAALRNPARLPVIAEIKRRSPSRGLLRDPFSPSDIAAAYAGAGAACLSVLTDGEFFGGASGDLKTAAAACDLPILRKDFMLSEWQIAESRALGADAVLLIVAALSADELRRLAAAAKDWGMATLAEAHNEEETRAALGLPDAIIGVNNRDLRTFSVDLRTTAELAPIVHRADKTRLLVSESGVHSPEDVARLRAAGADAFLIGEALTRQPAATLARLFPEGYSNNNSQA